ncbi:hypothetical protein V8F33_006207, partial [Rhypophila sp. PSN 637]
MAVFVFYSLALLGCLRSIRYPYTECAVGSPSSVVNIASHQRADIKDDDRSNKCHPYSLFSTPSFSFADGHRQSYRTINNRPHHTTHQQL